MNRWSLSARALLAASRRVNDLQRDMDDAAFLIASAVADGQRPSADTLDRFRAARESLEDARTTLETALARREPTKRAAA